MIERIIYQGQGLIAAPNAVPWSELMGPHLGGAPASAALTAEDTALWARINGVFCGDAGQDLGDSIYEAVLYVQGQVASLGSDCIEKPMTAAHRATLDDLLERAGFAARRH